MRSPWIVALVVAAAGCTEEVGSAVDMAPDKSLAFPIGCTSGAKDADETDVDCGGSCQPCDTGQNVRDGVGR